MLKELNLFYSFTLNYLYFFLFNKNSIVTLILTVKLVALLEI